MGNQLRFETSPYLLQHKDNPVHWRAWGDAALAEARDQDKPILLSVGYAACHWCHVMAHESFENPAIADLMNRLFVPIKVDREERPDLDSIYQHALALLGQRGGWPLTMFLTPAGEPFWGGTYFPPESRYGRPGFPDLLATVAEVYRADKARVSNNTSILIAGLQEHSKIQSGGAVDHAVLDTVGERFVTLFDPVDGGLKGAPKFPNCPLLENVWRYYKRTDIAAPREAILTTLDHMSQGGIYDHLGGGYSRYSTDDVWLAPHFEKMLYDNVQLIPLLLWAWQDNGRELYRRRIEETTAWLLREMRTPENAFAAAIDADSEHEEGKFYVWTDAEIRTVLGQDYDLFKEFYDVHRIGNWEGKTILNRLHHLELADSATEARLAESRAKLLAVRETRIRPLLDDKILADWNGLTIDALAKASSSLERPEWLAAAVMAWDFVTTTMMDADGRLSHSWRGGRSHKGNLDDYAAMTRAGLTLFEITGEHRYLEQAELWASLVQAHFADGAGGYYLTADDTENLIVRTRTASDTAVPSGNGLMLEVLSRLHILTGNDRYHDAAETLIAAFSGELGRDFFSLGTYLNGVDFHRNPLQIMIAGRRNAADTVALLRAVNSVSLPNKVLAIVENGNCLAVTHPAYGKGMIDGAAAAYVCEGRTCSLPLTDPSRLADELRKR